MELNVAGLRYECEEWELEGIENNSKLQNRANTSRVMESCLRITCLKYHIR